MKINWKNVYETALHWKMANKWRPLQLGFVGLRGAEAAVYGAGASVTKPDGRLRVLLKLDFENAFHCLICQVLLDAIKQNVSLYYPVFLDPV